MRPTRTPETHRSTDCRVAPRRCCSHPSPSCVAASPASAETCFAGTAELGCISGTIRTEVDVVAGVEVNVTGPNGSTRR